MIINGVTRKPNEHDVFKSQFLQCTRMTSNLRKANKKLLLLRRTQTFKEPNDKLQETSVVSVVKVPVRRKSTSFFPVFFDTE